MRAESTNRARKKSPVGSREICAPKIDQRRQAFRRQECGYTPGASLKAWADRQRRYNITTLKHKTRMPGGGEACLGAGAMETCFYEEAPWCASGSDAAVWGRIVDAGGYWLDILPRSTAVRRLSYVRSKARAVSQSREPPAGRHRESAMDKAAESARACRTMSWRLKRMGLGEA